MGERIVVYCYCTWSYLRPAAAAATSAAALLLLPLLLLLQGQPAHPDTLAAHVASQPGAAAVVLLDCTASEVLPEQYGTWMGQHGLHIITPNKKLGAGPMQRYQQLRQLQQETGRHFMYEVSGLLSLRTNLWGLRLLRVLFPLHQLGTRQVG